MSLIQNVNELNDLVRGLDTNVFADAFVNNRKPSEANVELLRVIRNYNTEEIPFIFKNIDQNNNDEKILTWDLNGQYIRLEILKWVENRQVYINLFTQNINKCRVWNPNTNLCVYIFSKDLFDSFLKRKLVTYPALMLNTLHASFFASELDSYAFSRVDFKPRGWPTDRNKSLLLDQVDIEMMKLREFNLQILTEGQKRALFLEYKRLKYSVCKKRLRRNRIFIDNVEAYTRFLILVTFLGEANEDELMEAYEMYNNYFELTEKTTRTDENENIPEINETENIIWEEIQVNEDIKNESEETEEIDINNIPFFEERKNINPIRIFSNIEPEDNFSISFLNKKKDRNDEEEN